MKYKALNPVRHDGKLYQAGEALEVDDTAADVLRACNAIEADDGSDSTPDDVEQNANYVEPEPGRNANQKTAKGKAKK